MEEAAGAVEDATAERICCPNDKSGSWLAHHLWILRASHCPTFGGSIVARFHPSDKGKRPAPTRAGNLLGSESAVR